MADNNIIFIGMPAVGKSTVGVVIAKRLGYKFVDTDILIQESEGKLLKDIIADVGPDGFLKVEDRVNALVKAERTVISPGGSVVYCENAMKHHAHQDNGTIVKIFKDAIGVKVNDGVYLITELQLEGKKRMSVKDYLNGHCIFEVDTKFE